MSRNQAVQLMTVTLVIVCAAGMASAAAISMNVVAVSSDGINPAPAILAPNEVAGLVPSTNWNNWEMGKIGAALVDGISISNLVDDAGNTTSTQIVFNKTANHGVASSSSYDYVPADEKLFRRYVDQWSSDRTSTYTVTGLPTSITSQGYNLIVYTSSPANLSNRAGTYQVDDGIDGTWDQARYVWAGANPYTSDAGYVEQTYASLAEAQAAYLNGNAEGNYIMFTGLTSDSFKLDITVPAGGVQRAPFNGFQIVAIPEPATMLLMVTGMIVGVLRRRR